MQLSETHGTLRVNIFEVAFFFENIIEIYQVVQKS